MEDRRCQSIRSMFGFWICSTRCHWPSSQQSPTFPHSPQSSLISAHIPHISLHPSFLLLSSNTDASSSHTAVSQPCCLRSTSNSNSPVSPLSTISNNAKTPKPKLTTSDILAPVSKTSNTPHFGLIQVMLTFRTEIDVRIRLIRREDSWRRIELT
ncbi:hypothetical protein BLNAU_7714 [Blattamonas nauphoetae]|uniref:Uncharacterized protein n=1 Tax=Blattamonas nauphoetae TaxID=2049346 RepID=A0ABQ9Y0S1_9EUKA|nr:hypothetical protein BLNAU_7714 [Blattamonas nauphoetae]